MPISLIRKIARRLHSLFCRAEQLHKQSVNVEIQIKNTVDECPHEDLPKISREIDKIREKQKEKKNNA